MNFLDGYSGVFHCPFYQGCYYMVTGVVLCHYELTDFFELMITTFSSCSFPINYRENAYTWNVLVLHWSKNALLLNVLVLQWLKGVTELLKLQSVTKIMWLPPTAPLINIGCKFTWSFLTTTAWHSLLRLGTTLNQGEGGFWVSLSKSNIFLGLFRENIVSLDHFCDWLQFLITTKIIFCSTLKHHSFWYIQMHHFKKQCFYYSIWTCIWL